MSEEWKARVYATYASTGDGTARASRAPTRRRAKDLAGYRRRYGRDLPADTAAPALDIGCGSGAFVETLRQLGYTAVEGIDFSESQIAAAAAYGVTHVSVAPALDYLRSRPNQYALITAFSMLEHQTRGELFELLDAIRAALLPGGILIAVVPNAKGLFGAHVRFADITHECSFTPSSVQQICGVTGFDLVAIREHGPIVHGAASALRWLVWQGFRGVLLAARLAEGADWRWPVFTQDLVFVARKPADGR